MNKEIIQVLSDLNVPVANMMYKGKETTYIVFTNYDTRSALRAEDVEAATSYYYQISIFSKSDYTSLVDRVREKMLDIGFIRVSEHNFFESDSEYYHKVMRFVITKGA